MGTNKEIGNTSTGTDSRGNQNLLDILEQGAVEWCQNARDSVINPETYDLLVNECHKREQEYSENPMVVARWFSMDGIDYFGLEISPDRPSVVWGCVWLPPEMGGGWEFSTFWVVREEGNPYSHGEALEDQTIPINIEDRIMEVPRWELDLYWDPIPLDELTTRVEANGGSWR